MAEKPNMLTSAWRDFWHTMTSNDRHASHDSPFRTGQHVPLPQSRHTPLTSVATSAMESRTDFNSPYAQDEPAANGFVNSPRAPMSPSSPYSPGMRSSMARPPDENPSIDGVNSGEIQMQSFSDGLPPPPPVGHSWKRIDRWLEDRFVELWDNMCEGATHNDVNELEHILDVTLPVEVRESLQIHDGQERGGLPTGLFFGCMILDCEEIVMEYGNWRKVNDDVLSAQPSYQPPQVPIKAVAGPSSSPAPVDKANNPMWRQDLLSRQDSQPPNAIQKAYSHPAWIPLARDWGGNCIAVDLAPGPAGKWGQVIIFGRDYDTKYVVARSWAAFLAQFADDLVSDKTYVDEETLDMKLKIFEKQNVEPPYLEILRWRSDQKYGRKPKRRPQSTLSINPNAPPASNGTSPYGSPASGGEDRGRSPHRLSRNGTSPRVPISSPLARVAEEAPQPVKVHTDEEKLIEMNTPRPSSDLNSNNATQKNSMESDKENGSEKGKGKSVVSSEEMKTVEI
ncbi:Cell wall assembly regulator [Diplodia seriata]|uniref:Cell wall assembly regulator n=2 Tax=Diplodia seriata TaxID=420778 RepID=A0A0G2EEB5_9PEZI|nr:putative glucan synthesis regulatory protein [Diplodia seriata]